MVYIYKKKIHKKDYYYLRVSKRVNGKQVVKDIAYLGNTLEDVKKNLDKYPKEVRKGYRTIKRFLDSKYYLEKVKKLKLKKNDYLDDLEKIEAVKLHFKEYFLKFDKQTVKETYEKFLIDFAFNTTSIEGNTINLQEAKKLLEDEVLPKNKTLREVYDLQNTEKVFFWLLDKKPRITEKLIIDIHDKLLDRIDRRKSYRTHDIRVFKSKFDSSPVKYVKTDMKLLFDWYKENKDLHPLVLAGMFHHKFEKIHPFADGNGRTGRMILNYILIKNKYPPFIVPKKRRSEYLTVLREADDSGLKDKSVKDYKPLISYLADEMIVSYWNNFNI